MRGPQIGTIIIIFFLPMDYFGLKLMDWWSMEDTDLVSYESDPLACLLYQYWRRWRKNKNDLKIQVKLSLLLMENEKTFCRIKGICPLGLVKQLVWKLASGRKWRGELTEEAGSDESNKLMRELSCSNAHKEVTVPFSSWGCPFFPDVKGVVDLQVALVVIVKKLDRKKNRSPISKNITKTRKSRVSGGQFDSIACIGR